MARYCIDASAALSWLLQQEPAVDAFWASLVEDDDLIVAQLFLPECTSVLRRAVFMRRMNRHAADVALEELLSRPFRTVVEKVQFERAMELASRFQHKKTYDMQYLAVAELTMSTLVTRDCGMRHAATQIGVPVRFLA